MTAGLQQALQHGDLYARQAAKDVLPLVWQALVLGMQLDAVVANPPYMGGKGLNLALRNHALDSFPESKSDLFAMFIERGFDWCKPSSFNCMVTMQNWMFSSSFEGLRLKILGMRTISTLMQIGYNSFPEMNSKVAKACATSLMAARVNDFVGKFVNLNSAPQSADKNKVFVERNRGLG